MRRLRTEPMLLTLAGTALIVLAGSVWLAQWLRLPQPSAAREDCAQAIAMGPDGPELALTSLAGDAVSLEGLRGSTVLLNTWATWCPPCRDELPALEAIARRYADRGLIVVGVNIGESRATVQSFVDRSGLTFPIWLDPDEASLRAFVTISLPASFLIDPSGVVRARWLGATCERELEAEILPILEAQEAR